MEFGEQLGADIDLVRPPAGGSHRQDHEGIADDLERSEWVKRCRGLEEFLVGNMPTGVVQTLRQQECNGHQSDAADQ